MKIVGLITEYNPFHKGHEYHIRKAKELTGADKCIVIMSGNYVQRGTPAYMDKHTRTHIALKHGADIIFELPVPFSCSSAEYFATASVTLLNKLGCIDYICFGSECQDIDTLKMIAYTLADAKKQCSHPLNNIIKEHMKSGISYAAARSLAINTFLKKDYSYVTNMPNNILGIEYLKALKILNSSIEPVCITRTNAAYHHNNENDSLYSASSLRNLINSSLTASSDLEELYSFDEIYKEVFNKCAPITEDDFSSITGCHIIEKYFNSTNVSLDMYNGIDSDLANRISSSDVVNTFKSFSDLIERIKTKNIAYSSVSRALLSLILNITKDDFQQYLNNDIASYIRLLGFKKEASWILNKIKKNGELNIIGQLSEINNHVLSDSDKKMLHNSIYCDELYNMIIRSKYRTDIPSEYSRKITIL